MAPTHATARLLALGISAAAMMAVPALAQGQPVGAAGAVNPAALSTKPGAGTKVIELGQQVIRSERIQTSGAGSVQLIFVDKTTLSIGPNSDLVIDEFVFNPATGTGSMVATLGRGAMRFVGGQVSHNGGATVRTPTTTLGIRGGVATITHGGQGTRAINHFGRIEVNASGQVEIIRRPGFSITIPIGQGPQGPVKVTQADLDAINGQLTSSRGQSGGAGNRPTETAVTRNNVGQANGNVPPQAIVEVQGQTVAKTPVATTPPTNTVIAQTNQIIQQAPGGNDAASFPPPPPPPVSPPPGEAFALTTDIDPSLSSTIPYVLGTAVASGPVYVSPIFGYRNPGAGTNGRETQPARVLQAALGINGDGALQTSNFMVMTGAFVDTAGSGAGTGFYFTGGFRHFTRRAANISMGRANGSVASVPGLETVDAQLLPTALTVNQDYRDDQGVQADTAFQRPGGGGVSSNYSYAQNFTRVSTPAGLGTNRPSVANIGFAAGMVHTLNVPLDTHIEAPVPISGSAFLLLDPTDSRAQLNMFLSADRMTATPAGGLDDIQIQMGNYDPGLPARSTYVDYDIFGGREGVANNAGGPSGPAAVYLTEVNGTPVLSDRSAFVSSGAVQPAGQFSGVTFCDCAYTRWGFWAQENSRTVSGTEYRDRIHLGTWVTGVLPSPSEVPTVGTATFNGHVIGTFAASGNQYVAAGQFTQTVDFGAQTGTFSIPLLDGRGYAGYLTLAGGSPFFVGTLNSVIGPTASGDLTGAFFRGVAGPVGEVGGMITFSGGGGYSGAATFVGRQ